MKDVVRQPLVAGGTTAEGSEQEIVRSEKGMGEDEEVSLGLQLRRGWVPFNH